MNWGKRILVLYLGFVALILTLAVTSFRHKTDLEYKDYYARELRFQDQLNAKQNAADLETPISHKVTGKILELRIPEMLLSNGFTGDIHLMRPSDPEDDIMEPLSPDKNGLQHLKVKKNGIYKLRVSIVSGHKNYFHEAILKFQ